MCNTKKTLVVILHYGSSEDTLACIDSIIESKTEGVDILVVENSDCTAFPLKPRGVRFVLSGGNIGFSAGNNIGIRIAQEESYDYVLLLNNDMVVDGDGLPRMKGILEKHPYIGMVGAVTYYYDKPDTIWAAGGNLHKYRCCIGGNKEITQGNEELFDTDYLPGSCIMFRTQIVGTNGFLSERYLFGIEEAQFCLEAKRHGWRIVVSKKAKAWHKIGISNQCKPSLFYNGFRNRFIFAEYLHGIPLGYLFQFLMLFNALVFKRIELRPGLLAISDHWKYNKIQIEHLHQADKILL